MDDRALLKQAFLEARSTEKEPSEQDLESFAISEKTDRKIHRIIYRKSRRKRLRFCLWSACSSSQELRRMRILKRLTAFLLQITPLFLCYISTASRFPLMLSERTISQ